VSTGDGRRTAILGRVVTTAGILTDGAVLVEGGRIVAVDAAADLLGGGVEVLRAPTGGHVLPGLVDLHVHGGGGAGFPDAQGVEEALRVVAEHRRHGTTTLVASLVTAEPDVLTARTRILAGLCAAGELAGIHYEGPFISPHRCGAQNPAAVRRPDATLTAELIEMGRGHVVTMTLAPELDGIPEVVGVLVDHGVVPSFGHTDATAEATRVALQHAAALLAARGARPTVTHLFNGMRPLHHRDPGPVPEMIAAAARGRAVVELIGDGVHLDPQLVRAVVELIGRDGAVLVTDAMAAAGMPDGEYELGGLPVVVSRGVARLRDGGALAGGTAHLIDVVRTSVRAGVPLADAVFMAATGPARVLGRNDVGSLAPGTRADVVLTDDDLRPVRVLRGGEEVRLTAG
jgi:N-acetylglucosamine-6-phosphate deacetylase